MLSGHWSLAGGGISRKSGNVAIYGWIKWVNNVNLIKIHKSCNVLTKWYSDKHKILFTQTQNVI